MTIGTSHAPDLLPVVISDEELEEIKDLVFLSFLSKRKEDISSEAKLRGI